MMIADILRDKGARVRTVKASDPLVKAISILARMRIGALLVSSDEKQIDGILSERDIVRALAEDAIDFKQGTVQDLMTSNVHTCAPEASILEVMTLMNERQIRHVPVEVDGVLAGIVSVRDIVDARLREAEAEQRQMAEYIAGNA